MLMFLLIASAWCGPAQKLPTNFWHVLAEVGFEKTTDKDGVTLELPRFSKHLQSWNGKKIKLKGYIIPVAEVGDQGKFMLSSLPFNICYFCGAAGPETVIEVETTQQVAFSTQAIWMEGVLVLNDRDPNHHMYRLRSAKTTTPP